MRLASCFPEFMSNTRARTTRVLSLVLAAACILGPATVSSAQPRVVKTPAAILSAPNGRAIGSVREGVPLRVLETRGAFARVSVAGFVERARISGQRGSASPRVGSRAAVLRSRGASAAKTIASLDAGTTVSVGGEAAPAGWVRVTRTGWVLRSSLGTAATIARSGTTNRRVVAANKKAPVASKASDGEVAASPSPSTPEGGTPAPAAAIVAGSSSTAAASAASPTVSTPVATTPAPFSASTVAPLADSTLVPTSNVVLRAAPDARPLATIAQGTTLVPLARERGWVRVRIEGWVPERELAPADTSVRAGISAADLRADPQGSRGKVVRWSVQVLARQTADALRRDLVPNETYLLARGPYEENTLLYLVVPPSLLESSKSITTLSNVMVTARVRTGKSELVGVPILDLLTVTPQK
jgi:hypothetical protein